MTVLRSVTFLFAVKFSIKSFKVPELFIEIPENATVGSLKVDYSYQGLYHLAVFFSMHYIRCRLKP